MMKSTKKREKEIKELEKLLRIEKEKILAKQELHDSFCLDKNELSDVLDEANANIQTSQELRFRNREVFYLKKINKALGKIENKTYGLCEDCDAVITYIRLKARPTAELCINCKEDAEVQENNNFFQKKSKSLGKTIAEY